MFRKFTQKPLTELAKLTTDELIEEIFMGPSRNYFDKNDHHFKPDANGVVKLPLARDGELTVRDFKNYSAIANYIRKIKTPFLWVNAWDDPVVQTKTTYETLQQAYKVGFLRDNMAMITTRYGGHAGFPDAYGTFWVQRMLTNYFSYWGKESSNPEYYYQWKKPRCYNTRKFIKRGKYKMVKRCFEVDYK